MSTDSEDFATMFQFTRPRGARQEMELDVIALCCVSIHAPARGATRRSMIVRSASHVSIHAPARGATDEDEDEEAYTGFNSRAREGRDRSRLR